MALVITTSAPGLRGRFTAAAAHEPLCALPAARRAELDVLLGRVASFDDLPGWWQAALLAAEASRAGAAPRAAGGSCCGGAATAEAAPA